MCEANKQDANKHPSSQSIKHTTSTKNRTTILNYKGAWGKGRTGRGWVIWYPAPFPSRRKYILCLLEYNQEYSVSASVVERFKFDECSIKTIACHCKPCHVSFCTDVHPRQRVVTSHHWNFTLSKTAGRPHKFKIDVAKVYLTWLTTREAPANLAIITKIRPKSSKHVKFAVFGTKEPARRRCLNAPHQKSPQPN